MGQHGHRERKGVSILSQDNNVSELIGRYRPFPNVSRHLRLMVWNTCWISLTVKQCCVQRPFSIVSQIRRCRIQLNVTICVILQSSLVGVNGGDYITKATLISCRLAGDRHEKRLRLVFVCHRPIGTFPLKARPFSARAVITCLGRGRHLGKRENITSFQVQHFRDQPSFIWLYSSLRFPPRF